MTADHPENPPAERYKGFILHNQKPALELDALDAGGTDSPIRRPIR